jgi:hypothetical protein
MDTYFVNLDNSSSGDGTTNETDSSADSAFISLDACISSVAGNITGISTSSVTVHGKSWTNIAVQIILDQGTGSGDDTAGTEGVKILAASWTTDSTHRLLIRAADGTTIGGQATNESRHKGVKGAGYRLYINPATSFNPVVKVDTDNVILIDIEAVPSGGTTGVGGFGNNTAMTDGVYYVNCMATSTNWDAFEFHNNQYYINCIAYDGNTGSFEKAANVDVSGTRFYNCLTLGSGAIGYDTSFAEGKCKNSVAVTSTGVDFDSDYASGNLEYCASEDSTAIGTGAVTGVSTTNDFQNFSSDDWRPKASGALDGAGNSLAADGDFPFAFDIEGNTRSTWSIGPWDAAAASGTTITVPTGPWR